MFILKYFVSCSFVCLPIKSSNLVNNDLNQDIIYQVDDVKPKKIEEQLNQTAYTLRCNRNQNLLIKHNYFDGICESNTKDNIFPSNNSNSDHLGINLLKRKNQNVIEENIFLDQSDEKLKCQKSEIKNPIQQENIFITNDFQVLNTQTLINNVAGSDQFNDRKENSENCYDTIFDLKFNINNSELSYDLRLERFALKNIYKKFLMEYHREKILMIQKNPAELLDYKVIFDNSACFIDAYKTDKNFKVKYIIINNLIFLSDENNSAFISNFYAAIEKFYFSKFYCKNCEIQNLQYNNDLFEINEIDKIFRLLLKNNNKNSKILFGLHKNRFIQICEFYRDEEAINMLILEKFYFNKLKKSEFVEININIVNFNKFLTILNDESIKKCFKL